MKNLFWAVLVITLFLFFLTVLIILGINNKNSSKFTLSDTPETNDIRQDGKTAMLNIIKDLGEPYLYHFGLKESDFKKVSDAGFNVISGNFDICASDEDVEFYLNTAKKYGLSVIMPAGSGEAEWGYVCDMPVGKDQKPVWQGDLVKDWIIKWRDYENIFAWDISNEAGSVMPNSDKGYYLTSPQLIKAYETVKNTDPQRPVMIRMNGWFFYDFDENFFRKGNPFVKDTADIVMVNLYSNIGEYNPDFVSITGSRAKEAILEIDPDVDIIISLGIWEESPLWHTPSPEQLKNDYDSSLKLDPVGIAFFKYGAIDSYWYLPDDDLWDVLLKIIEK